MAKVTAATLPPLRLSKDDKAELRALCDDLEHEVLTSYEVYLYQHNRTIDPTRWKPVRAKDNIHVYRERRAFKHTSTVSSSSSISSRVSELLATHSSSNSSSNSNGSIASSTRHEMATTLEIGPMHAMAATSSMPVMMVAGTTSGSLDDALYGVTLSDTPSVRRRSEYQNEKLEDCAVVATLGGPTHEDPFHFRGVLWFLKDYPIINVIVKPRDLLQVTSIRQSQTSRGERVGIVVYHSITHHDFPEFTDPPIIRVQASLSVVFRQVDQQRTEIYMTNFVDPMGKVPEMFITQDVAQALITSMELPNTGLKKKLHSLMRSRQHLRSLPSDTNAPKSPTPCVSCNKVLGRAFCSRGAVCQLCYMLACSKCRVTKKIAVETTNTSIVVRPFQFCLGCIMAARGTSAASISRSEHDLRDQMKDQSVVGDGSLARLVDLV